MKRVLLLVFLFVSLVELDWERGRVYLLSSIASLFFIVWSERMSRRKAQLFPRPMQEPQDAVPRVRCLLQPTKQGDQCT